MSRLTAFDTAISRSSRPSASPLSIDFARERGAFLQVLGLAGDDQRGGGVEDAMSRNGPLLALEHVEQRRGVVLGVAAAQRLRLGALQARRPRA